MQKVYRVNDVVYMKGFGKTAFLIDSIYTTSIYVNFRYETVTNYDLKNIETGEKYRAFADELTLKEEQDKIDLEKYLNRLNKAFDIYNDLMDLHEYYKNHEGSEEKYIHKANRVMRFIKKLII